MMQSCAKSWGIFLAKSVTAGAPCTQLSAKSRVVWKVQCRIRNRGASAATLSRGVRTSAAASSRQIERLLPRHDDFAERHIGPGEREKREMLDALGLEVRYYFLLFLLYSFFLKHAIAGISISCQVISFEQYLETNKYFVFFNRRKYVLSVCFSCFFSVAGPVDRKHSAKLHPYATQYENG